MSSYIDYMGTDSLNLDDLEVGSLTADHIEVKGDIAISGTVDGVDISVLDFTVRQQDGRLLVVENEVKNHEERITSAEDEIKNHEERISTVEDELSHIQLDYVDTKTAQTINGSKTFNDNLTTSNIIANGYINCNVLTSSGNVRGVNFLSTGFSQVRDANSTGQVISGMSIRGGGRSQQFFLSNGDGISETYYGSDLNGTGTADTNHKWCISSRQASDGRMIFYRAPFYTGNSYDPVMDFKNTLNPETKSYDCTINMHKPVNFNGSVSINGQNVSVTSYKTNPDRLYWLGKFINMLDYWTTCSIQKICNTVTMTIGAFTARHMVDGPTASWYIESNKNLSPIPVAFRPSVDLTFPVVIRVTMDNIGRVSRCIVKTDGSVWICGGENDFTHFQGRLAFEAFSVSWVVGL